MQYPPKGTLLGLNLHSSLEYSVKCACRVNSRRRTSLVEAKLKMCGAYLCMFRATRLKWAWSDLIPYCMRLLFNLLIWTFAFSIRRGNIPSPPHLTSALRKDGFSKATCPSQLFLVMPVKGALVSKLETFCVDTFKFKTHLQKNHLVV